MFLSFFGKKFRILTKNKIKFYFGTIFFFAVLFLLIFVITTWLEKNKEIISLKKFAGINGLKMTFFTFENKEYARFVFASSENNFYHSLTTLTPTQREHRKKVFNRFVNYKTYQQLLDSLAKFEKLNNQESVKKINIQLVFVDYKFDNKTFMFVSKINYLQDLSFFDCSLDFTVIESYPTSSINFCLGFSGCIISSETIDSISRNECIKWINASNVDLSEEMFAKLCTTPNVTRIELTRIIKNDKWIKYLACVKKLQYLRILGLDMIHNNSAQEFSKLKNLVTLEIGGSDLTQVDLSFLDELPNIKEFIIPRTKLKQGQLSSIKNFSNIKISGTTVFVPEF
jgi:hypothetical protein